MSLEDIQERLESLAEFALDDDQRNIEAPSLSLNLTSIPETNFVERNAYDSKFLSEMYLISKMRDILDRGEYFVNIIYTYRSCSKAIPQPKNSDDAAFKEELHAKTYEVLEPEIQKVKDLFAFQNDTIQFFCDQVKLVMADDRRGEVPAEGLLWCMIKILDLLALLDALLNMKACLVTDFSFYKRTSGYMKGGGGEGQDKQLSELGLFLAKQNRITDNLKSEIKEVKAFDEFLVILSNMCAHFIETDRYVLPSDKHSLLRVIPYALFLMDGREGNLINIFKNKKVNIKRFAAIFKRFPVVTLYGDMQIKLENMIKSAPNYVAGAWPLADTEKMAREYELIHHLPAIRQQHNEFMGKFNTIVQMIKLDEPELSDVEFCAEVTNNVLDGLTLISNLTSRVLQQSAWKYFKPSTHVPGSPTQEGEAAPSVENSYEQVVKNNYSREERFALAEMVGLIKGLAASMIQEDGILSPYIRYTIHQEIQHAIQYTVGELLAYATKKKRPVRTDLTQIRNLAVDFVDGSAIDESAFSKKKKADITINSRPIGPSLTQLELLRTAIYNLFAPRLNGKKPFEKDISKDSMRALEDFYGRSFNYSYLLDFKECIIQMIDLGDLWYREFYLELTKRLQFPIDLSLPWILTNTILETEDLSMMEYVLYPLDIYNDAANRALNSLHQQFLYDEIEAEVNLCFDQLIFKLSNSIYSSYKTHAASLMLDRSYGAQLGQVMNSKRLQVPKTRFDVILTQRHYQLLGRFVDLNNLIAQRMNNLLRRNVDNAISRFEAKDLSSVVELETQLKTIRLTHQLLSKNFLQLDSFYAILNEINGSTSLISYHSRIAFHVISECASDFFPNFNYNSATKRFTRAIIEFGEPLQRENAPSPQLHWLYGNRELTAAFSAYHANFSKLFGIEHARSMLSVLGTNNVSLVVDEILTNLNLKIENVLVPYVSALLEAMPPNSKCPLYNYQVPGGMGYFSGKLVDIIQYPPLQSEVFQQFKEMGNAICFLQMVDLAKEEISLQRFTLLAPLLGYKPQQTEPPAPENAPFFKLAKDVSDYVREEDLAVAEEAIDPLLNTIWEADFELRKPSNMALFKAALDRVYMSVRASHEELDQQTPELGAVIPVECAREFYRVFSALKYIFCLPLERGQGEYDNFDLFGDGMLWAGITMIHCLGQRKRYDSFDFADHLLRMAEVFPADPSERSAHGFLINASRVRSLADSIFLMLNNYLPEYAPEVIRIHPPADDLDLSQFMVANSAAQSQKALSPRVSASTASPRAPSPRTNPAPAPAPPPSAPHPRDPSTAPTNLPPPPSNVAPAPPPDEAPAAFPPPPSQPAPAEPPRTSFPPPPPGRPAIATQKSNLPPPPGSFPPPPGPGKGSSKTTIKFPPPPPSSPPPPK